MVRIQLHLTAAQDKALKARARASGTTRADLIRRAIDGLLAERAEAADALVELIGAAGAAGRRDLSERHDELVYSPKAETLPSAAERR